jgi:transcriptional regulator with XRE-family HTH domain
MFANRIRELRQQQGMTMTELAFKAGLSVGIIQRYETGKTDPPLSVAHRVAQVLGEVELAVMVVVALFRAWHDTAPDPSPEPADYALVDVGHICEARSRREARKGIGGVA